MAIVPQNKLPCAQWGLEHINPFAANAAAFGLTPAQASTFEGYVNTLTNAITAQGEARAAAIAATELADSALADFKAFAAVCLAAIKAKAEAAADPTAVYALAQVPSPAVPSPAGPPTDVTNLAADLQNDGTILITWKGTVRASQFFTVWRRISTQVWDQIGSTAEKKFVDTGLPAGSTSATYMVRSHRGGMSSPGCEPVIIVFGSQALPQAA